MPLRRDTQLQDVVITTDRLILRPTNIIDLEPINREFNERITRYMTPPAAQSSTDVALFIADSMEGLNNNTNLQLTAVSREQPHEFTGCLGLHHPETRTPELGIWIAEKFHRQGLGLEAIEALCAWAAKEIDCDYLQYPVDRANQPSRRIPESLGAEIEDEYDRITTDGRTLNLVEYRIYPETL
jgi:[ribosomal protein S5]-alanine N-acetyltransferase